MSKLSDVFNLYIILKKKSVSPIVLPLVICIISPFPSKGTVSQYSPFPSSPFRGSSFEDW